MKTLIVWIAGHIGEAASGAAFKQVSFATSTAARYLPISTVRVLMWWSSLTEAVFNKESWHTQALQLKERGLKSARN